MLFNIDEKVLQKIAYEIEYLIELQIQQEPFIDINLSKVDILRGKTCLAIFNFSFFIFLINN